MKFSTFKLIHEAATAKDAEHIVHAEDLILTTKSRDGAQRAIDVLFQVVKVLSGTGVKDFSLRPKLDGAPALFVGTVPPNSKGAGKFFLSTKSIFNKTPKVNLSVEDIKTNHPDAGLQKTLTTVFEILSKKDFGGNIWSLDLMFTKDSVKEYTIANKKMIGFRPNTILYAVPADSKIASQIKSSDIGVYVHSRFTGDSFEELVPEAISGSITLPEGVWQFPEEAYDKAKPKDVGIVKESVHKCETALKAIPDHFFGEEKFFPLLLRFQNELVRGNKHSDDAQQNVEWFKEFIQEDAPSPKAVDKKEAIVWLSDEHREDLMAYFRYVVAMDNAKIAILHSLAEDNSEIKEYFVNTSSTPPDYTPTTHEGFVVRTGDIILKIVDRYGFSKENFANTKWDEKKKEATKVDEELLGARSNREKLGRYVVSYNDPKRNVIMTKPGQLLRNATEDDLREVAVERCINDNPNIKPDQMDYYVKIPGHALAKYIVAVNNDGANSSEKSIFERDGYEFEKKVSIPDDWTEILQQHPDFMNEAPSNYLGVWTGVIPHFPNLVIKKKKAKDGFFYLLKDGAKNVMWIGGFENSYLDAFSIHAVNSIEEYRQKGIFQPFVQFVANQYPSGAYSEKFQTSQELQAAMRKVTGHIETADTERHNGRIIIPNKDHSVAANMLKFSDKDLNINEMKKFELSYGIEGSSHLTLPIFWQLNDEQLYGMIQKNHQMRGIILEKTVGSFQKGTAYWWNGYDAIHDQIRQAMYHEEGKNYDHEPESKYIHVVLLEVTKRRFEIRSDGMEIDEIGEILQKYGCSIGTKMAQENVPQNRGSGQTGYESTWVYKNKWPEFATNESLDESIAFEGDYQQGFFQRLVAGSYMISPNVGPGAKEAWAELAEKITRQHKFVSSKYNIVGTSDTVNHSYKDTSDLRHSLQTQRDAGVKKPSMFVYDQEPGPEGDKGHPFFSKDLNTNLRAVHDLIAHAPQKQGTGKNDQGYTFLTARGEFGAYNRHLKTLGNGSKAAAALYTEVVAQTCCYFVYDQFVKQKAVILTDFDHKNIGLLDPHSKLNKYFEPSKVDLVKRKDFNFAAFEKDFPELSKELVKQEHSGKALFKMLPLHEDNLLADINETSSLLNFSELRESRNVNKDLTDLTGKEWDCGPVIFNPFSIAELFQLLRNIQQSNGDDLYYNELRGIVLHKQFNKHFKSGVYVWNSFSACHEEILSALLADEEESSADEMTIVSRQHNTTGFVFATHEMKDFAFIYRFGPKGINNIRLGDGEVYKMNMLYKSEGGTYIPRKHHTYRELSHV